MSKQPLSVLVVGMDQRSRAALRLAFLSQGQNEYVIHNQDDRRAPDLAIVDGDGPAGPEIWNEFRAAYPNTPAIFASLDQIEIEDAECIRKPLRVETLFAAMVRVLHAPMSAPGRDGRKALDVGRIVRRLAEPSHAASAPAASEGVLPFTRPEAEARPTEFSPITAPRYFDPSKGLLAVLTTLRKQGMAAWIDTPEQHGVFALFPNLGMAYQGISDSELAAYCSPDIRFSYRSIGQEAHHLFERSDLKSLDNLIWQVAIRTSQGRLPQGIKINGSHFRLRQWPNFTRLDPIPDGLRIAAFLSRTPASISLIIKMLRMQPENLYTFISASASLGLLVRVEPQESRSEGAIPLRPPISSERHGMLTRLLRRIAGL